ncbi:MAG: Asp-tRNA(Asn)/Glu-tRNA(Gln) amidotransferase subunit GatC [Alphaproteobacteria bacterium]|nr:Asp-tRNA(Asn)/Glu-tRNA(Gln) amidotransferase subunit GatC [Alphaproteobacteria bacterium]
MAVDNNTVKQVAFLARLKVEDSKVEQTKDEFNKILNWVEQLNEVNTENVEPLVAVNDTTLPLREDEITDGNLKTEILKNAPMQEFGYFAVPKVVE